VEVGLFRPKGGLTEEFFYEAACCQAPFELETWVTPSVVNRASGFLTCEASVCLERTSIRADLFCPTPNAVFPQGRFGKRRGEHPHVNLGYP
jgi:hypothetical protein